MDPHERAERRSVAYHRAIAERIGADPALVVRARGRVEQWKRTGDVHPEYVGVWERVLALPPGELEATLVAETEAMRAARQASPFAGALTPRERWRIWRSVAP